MTVKDLQATLTELGVPFESSANKAELEALLAAQEHVVTQEDLDNNQALVEEGVEVGEVIHLPFAEDDEFQDEVLEEPVEEVEDEEVVEEVAVEAGEYEVVLNLKHDNLDYAPGDTVALTAEQAERLLKTGTVK